MIRCCKDCVAPKRHVGCHSSCPEYLKAKEEHDRVVQMRDEKRAIENRLLEYEIRKRLGRHKHYR